MAQAGKIVEPVWVDHQRIGKLFIGLMVIDHDHVEAEPSRLG